MRAASHSLLSPCSRNFLALIAEFFIRRLERALIAGLLVHLPFFVFLFWFGLHCKIMTSSPKTRLDKSDLKNNRNLYFTLFYRFQNHLLTLGRLIAIIIHQMIYSKQFSNLYYRSTVFILPGVHLCPGTLQTARSKSLY